jgi:tryptophan synthase alpha chain
VTKRLADAFAKAKAGNRPALITLVIPGYPSMAETDAVFDAMIEGGADIVEVEIPFSDPLADGSTIQRAAEIALEQGVTPADCLDFVRRARSRHATTPIVFMTYLNPVLAYGLQRFADDAAVAGADAFILTDLPPEEAGPARQALDKAGLDLILLVAPTSSDERIALIGQAASGFVYCVSIAGVTGARTDLPPGLADFVSKVRRSTSLPLAVGFGISRREHIESLTGVADGTVVGSAFMDVINKNEASDRPRAVREYVETLRGTRSA